MHPNKLKKIALTLGVLTAVNSQATYAQEESSATTLLEEIVVTAQKREQSLNDVPVALTVLGSEQIENAYAVGLEGLAAAIPSFTFRKGNTNRNSGNFLRGIGTISFSIAAEPSVSTVVDGVVLGRSGQAFTDLADLQRIEVLRGPQGTLFGKNSSAGVINIVTKGPTQEFESGVDLSYFEDDETRIKAYVSGPLSERAAGRLTAFVGEFDGPHTNVFNGESINGYSRRGLRGILDYELSDTISTRTTLEYYDADDNCCIELISDRNIPISEAVQTLRTVDNDLSSVTENETIAGSFTLDWDLGDHTFTSISAFNRWENVELADRDFRSSISERFYRDESLDAGGRLASRSSTNNFQQHEFGPQTTDTISQEFRFSSNTDGPLQYILGAYYSNVEIDRSFTRTSGLCIGNELHATLSAQTLNPDNIGGLSALNGGCETGTTIINPQATARLGTEFDNLAAFGNLTYDVNDRLTLLGGLRVTRDELSYRHRRDGNADLEALVRIGGGAPGIRGVDYPELPSERADGQLVNGTDSTSNTNVSGKVGFQYDLNDTWNLYGTYSQGYKGPAFNISFSFREAREPAVGEETSDAFEIGLKGTIGNHTSLGIAAYTTEIEGFQQNSDIVLNNSISSNLTNAGTVETTGLEIDFTSYLNSRLRLSGGLAWMPTVNIKELNCSSVINFANVSGDAGDLDDAQACLARSGDQERLALAPDLKAALNLSYSAPLTSNLDWHFNLNGTYQDEVFSNDREDLDELLDARTILDATFGISTKDERHRLTFIIKNLTDENYATQVIDGQNVPTSLIASGRALRYQIPREADRYFGVNYRVQF
ncbi:MAG: iron complex outermembrane receptor protein [Arenicella sp.]